MHLICLFDKQKVQLTKQEVKGGLNVQNKIGGSVYIWLLFQTLSKPELVTKIQVLAAGLNKHETFCLKTLSHVGFSLIRCKCVDSLTLGWPIRDWCWSVPGKTLNLNQKGFSQTHPADWRAHGKNRILQVSGFLLPKIWRKRIKQIEWREEEDGERLMSSLSLCQIYETDLKEQTFMCLIIETITEWVTGLYHIHSLYFNYGVIYVEYMLLHSAGFVLHKYNLWVQMFIIRLVHI